MPTPPKSGTDWLRIQRGKAEQAKPVTPTCDVTSARDSEVERWLNSHGVKYAPKTMIPIGLIDEKQSLGNQARDVPLIQENVDRYALAIKQGEYLPPIVVYPSGQKVVIVDGNNRHAAHKKNGAQFVPGYVIDEHTPSETILLLTVAANNGHGETPDLKWRIKQAVHLVSIGFTAEKAADAAGVTRAMISDYQRMLRADARAKSMKIQGFSDLPPTSRRDIGALQLDSVFYQAARCVIDTEMITTEVRDLIRKTKDYASESEQVAYIATVIEERKLEAKQRKATKRTSVASPYQSLLSALGKLVAVDGAAVARQVITDIDRRELIRRLDSAGLKLIELQTILESKHEEVQRGA